ncbi:restriction endonuclease subunit S [Aeromonas caviae]|uniref:restriction endonuclease subunit S n=1 Tax=Aeromonas caviae TaxID=648 RepID=UPI002B4956B4|nr:restriction endonuclease subunit S [Aeromonas caviae]
MSEVVATAQQGLAGKYKPYPQYKDSGVEWLQLCPSSWETKALKYIVSCNDEVLSESTDPDMEFEYIDIGGVSSSEGITRTESMRFSGAPSRARRIVRQGDIIVSTVRTYLEAIAPISLEFDGKIASTGFAVLRPKYLLSGFAKYALRARHFIDSVVARSTGVSYPAINSSELIDIKIVVPSLKEQQTIASFLDYETARIDRLIAQQQRLIELLKEKRQAVISHAVTKGLNPDATMKDSGIEWLGQVPEHWIVKPLRHLGYCQNGINIGAEAFGSGYPFVSYGDAYKNRVLPETGSGLVQSTPEDRKRYSLLAGDVLFTRTSETIEEIGFASTCLKTIENACFAGFLIRFRPNPNDLDANYSKYYFSNQLLRAFFIKEMNLITRASLSQDLLKAMPVVLPPRTEQKAIAEVLDEKSKRFDRLQQLGDEQIKILQERRTALISAAVTGKIDLRGWTPPADEVAA